MRQQKEPPSDRKLKKACTRGLQCGVIVREYRQGNRINLFARALAGGVGAFAVAARYRGERQFKVLFKQCQTRRLSQ